MTRHIKHACSESLVVFWDVYNLNASVWLDRVDLHSESEEASDGNDLRVVALHIHLLHFPHAELGHIPHEVLEHDGVLLQMQGCQEPRVHNDVGGFFFVGEQLNQVLRGLALLQSLQLLDLIEEQVVEVFNGDLIVADGHESLLGSLQGGEHLGVLGVFLVLDEVLEDREKEGAVKAVAVASESAHLRVAGLEGIEAKLEFVVLVLLFQHF